MSSFSEYVADADHMRIQIGSGGYILHSYVARSSRMDEEIAYETSVFTSIEGLTAAIARIAKTFEGNLKPGEKLGPLRTEPKRPEADS